MTHRSLALIVAATVAASAVFAVTPEEASRLKSQLTPLGAEKAGNKEGTIPAWTGGFTTATAEDRNPARRRDPFRDEKPVLSINARNVEQHADKLADGTKAMFKKYPEYRIDVYPTRRTAAAPQWVYDNTFKNATRGKLVGDVPEGVYGGIPFPIPKSGAEVMWNHLLRWLPPTWQWSATQYQITTDGRPVLTTDGTAEQQMPYYFQDGSPEQFAKVGEYQLVRLLNVGPPLRAGEALLARNNVQGEKSLAWLYLTGQRRVRKLPNPCCDAPTPATAGVMSFDEIETWTGRLDRFDWKLVGKKEMYIPYNNNRIFHLKDAELLGRYPNPDHARWELHRVWVVEATLKPGQRHQAPKGRYYCDEDTWQCMIADRWDANGQLWKTLWSYNFVAPDLPGTITGPWGFNDLISGGAFIGNLYGTKERGYVLKARAPESTFTPDALAGEGVR